MTPGLDLEVRKGLGARPEEVSPALPFSDPSEPAGLQQPARPLQDLLSIRDTSLCSGVPSDSLAQSS